MIARIGMNMKSFGKTNPTEQQHNKITQNNEKLNQTMIIAMNYYLFICDFYLAEESNFYNQILIYFIKKMNPLLDEVTYLKREKNISKIKWNHSISRIKKNHSISKVNNWLHSLFTSRSLKSQLNNSQKECQKIHF